MVMGMSMAPLDPVGNVSLVLQIVILFLLILGLPLVKGFGVKKNLMRHGYLTVLALILHTFLIFIVMIPTFGNGLGELGKLSFPYSLTVWSHVILGTTAEVLGILIVGFWVTKPLSNMACMKMKKIMLPLFVIWTLAIINGALVHIFGML
jgi:hypothetical protein